jgi:hypothetical protein
VGIVIFTFLVVAAAVVGAILLTRYGCAHKWWW